ncbi:Peroxidase [Heracleum sosnowskyi]|uniref:Peroxidase n=1 Tax=Heracleum sosnowskyi TaxID=360622 RepID=A0AAD8IPF3_9APIA|nr:Peroxidase [Heracleum sosnowskyi]
MRPSFMLLLLALVLVNSVLVCNGKKLLKMKYYRKTCSSVESIVRDITWRKVAENSSFAPKLLRLHYHDCFVRGCDGSILLDSTDDQTKDNEKAAGPSRSLAGYEVVDEIKAKLEEECPGVVSCADILALAARDAVSYQFRRRMWKVFTGRKDGRVSVSSEVTANMPSASSNLTTLLSKFETHGLNMMDLVTLSGAHTIGTTRCVLLSRRLYNFTGRGDTDPSLDPEYANTLRKICPNPSNPATRVEMDPQSSSSFDSHYFRIVNQHKGMFVSDAALLTDQKSAQMAQLLENPVVFIARFAQSMKKMNEIISLEAGEGEVRKNCRVVN